jgi:hypothetical protein
VPWEQALDIVLKTFYLGKSVEGNIIRIAPLSVFGMETELKIRAREAELTAESLEAQRFHAVEQPIKAHERSREIPAEEVTTTPTLMLYQRPFYLTETDYERIKKPNSIMTGAGGALLVYALPAGIVLFLKLSKQSFSLKVINDSITEIILIIMSAIFGAVLIFGGFLFSSTKRKVFRQIDKHFKENAPDFKVVNKNE